MRITRAGYARPSSYRHSMFSWLCTVALGSSIVGAFLASAGDSYRWIA